MNIKKILSHEAIPCVMMGTAFAAAAQAMETKPIITVLGLLTIFIVYLYFSKKSKYADVQLQADLRDKEEENEGLKKNLVQVYSMIQQQQKREAPSGPPPPMPPNIPHSGSKKNPEPDDDEKARPFVQ